MSYSPNADTAPPQALEVVRSEVTKLVIKGAARLDTITVFLEDLGVRAVPLERDPNYKTGRGSLTVRCGGESWTAYWGAMGQRSVADFVAQTGDEYILNCLSRGLSTTRFSGKALKQLALRCIVDRRRERNRSNWELGYLDAHDARALYRRADELRDVESERECWNHSELLTLLFGSEWHYPVEDHAKEENPDYMYLLQIVRAVQQALKPPAQDAAA